MTKKKKTVEPVEVHRIYTGRHIQSSRSMIFGRCLCGATLEGQEAIDEHRLLIADVPPSTGPARRAG